MHKTSIITFLCILAIHSLQVYGESLFETNAIPELDLETEGATSYSNFYPYSENEYQYRRYGRHNPYNLFGSDIGFNNEDDEDDDTFHGHNHDYHDHFHGIHETKRTPHPVYGGSIPSKPYGGSYGGPSLHVNTGYGRPGGYSGHPTFSGRIPPRFPPPPVTDQNFINPWGGQRPKPNWIPFTPATGNKDVISQIPNIPRTTPIPTTTSSTSSTTAKPPVTTSATTNAQIPTTTTSTIDPLEIDLRSGFK
ncbi:uncharacterized protein [Musca autumnalis]|uniref:uncharacterized protein n=1 Tax=Musca autumnalis TaxID=221902 RepID=UPI003CF543E3